MHTSTCTNTVVCFLSKTILLQGPQPRWLSPSEPYRNSAHNDVPHAPVFFFSNRFVKDFASLWQRHNVSLLQRQCVSGAETQCVSVAETQCVSEFYYRAYKDGVPESNYRAYTDVVSESNYRTYMD